MADVTVDATAPYWRNYPGVNMAEIQKALMSRVKTARIIRSASYDRVNGMLEIARPRPPHGPAEWLDFWDDVLSPAGHSIRVLTVHRWDVVRVISGGGRRRAPR